MNCIGFLENFLSQCWCEPLWQPQCSLFLFGIRWFLILKKKYRIFLNRIFKQSLSHFVLASTEG